LEVLPSATSLCHGMAGGHTTSQIEEKPVEAMLVRDRFLVSCWTAGLFRCITTARVKSELDRKE